VGGSPKPRREQWLTTGFDPNGIAFRQGLIALREESPSATAFSTDASALATRSIPETGSALVDTILDPVPADRILIRNIGSWVGLGRSRLPGGTGPATARVRHGTGPARQAGPT
jgi:hypothetical protein